MRDSREQNQILYFIALVPHNGLRNEIRTIKEKMLTVYGAGHALKSPAHITLQRPFRKDPGDEPELVRTLAEFVPREKPFMVDLDGFGAFAPKVIYIRVKDHTAISALHTRLKEVLARSSLFDQSEIMNDVQPHITLATRDLTRDAFSAAWHEMKEAEFRSSFVARSLFLLKHNGRHWEIMQEFFFGDDE
jgi:2'-5' RNA ligase